MMDICVFQGTFVTGTAVTLSAHLRDADPVAFFLENRRDGDFLADNSRVWHGNGFPVQCGSGGCPFGDVDHVVDRYLEDPNPLVPSVQCCQ